MIAMRSGVGPALSRVRMAVALTLCGCALLACALWWTLDGAHDGVCMGCGLAGVALWFVAARVAPGRGMPARSSTR